MSPPPPPPPSTVGPARTASQPPQKTLARQAVSVVVKGYSPHVIATPEDLRQLLDEARNIQRLHNKWDGLVFWGPGLALLATCGGPAASGPRLAAAGACSAPVTGRRANKTALCVRWLDPHPLQRPRGDDSTTCPGPQPHARHIVRLIGLGCFHHQTADDLYGSLFMVEEFVGTMSLKAVLRCVRACLCACVARARARCVCVVCVRARVRACVRAWVCVRVCVVHVRGSAKGCADGHRLTAAMRPLPQTPSLPLPRLQKRTKFRWLYTMGTALRWASSLAGALAELHGADPPYIHGDVKVRRPGVLQRGRRRSLEDCRRGGRPLLDV